MLYFFVYYFSLVVEVEGKANLNYKNHLFILIYVPIRTLRLCLVSGKFEGKCEGKKIQRKSRRKEKVKENKKID